MAASDGPRVGVVGDDALAGDVQAAGGTPTVGDAGTVLAAEPDWVVAAGEASLVDLVSAGASVPVLAVGADPGVPSVPRSAVTGAVESVLAGRAEPTTRRLLAVDVDGESRGPMLRDAMLTTGEPARISEYAVRSGDRTVAQFRADGVVVATPAGSDGYFAAAGGPLLAPGTGTVGVVPVAPFQTDSDHWVLDDAVALSVRRDEHVVLVLDGRERGRVSAGTSVELVPSGHLTLYAVQPDWKNSNGRPPE